MSQGKNIKKFTAKAGNKSPTISHNPRNKNTISTSMGTNEPSTSAAPPPFKMANSDLIVDKTSKDWPVHVGPQSIVKEPIYLEGIKRSDVMNNIDDCCISCKNEKKEKSLRGKLKNIKNNCTPKKCLLSGMLIILIEILLMVVFLNDTIVKRNDEHFINVNRIEIMNNNLDGIVLRKDWVINHKAENCIYRCPKLKSKIRFIILPYSYFTCKSTRSDWSNINKVNHQCLGIRTKKFWTIDMYYNYVISGMSKNIYEGRSLTCPYNESSLNEDHSTMITVGIEYCYPGRSERNAESSLKVKDIISDLVSNLKRKDMLTQNYVLDFPDVCEGSYLLERVSTSGLGQVTIYKNELYRNLEISTKIEPIVFSKLLFSPKCTRAIENDTASSPPLEISFPFSGSTSIPSDKVSSRTSNRITIRITFVEGGPDDPQKYEIFSNKDIERCRLREIFERERLPNIVNYLKKNQIYTLDTSLDNFFIVVPGQIMFRLRPSNNSSNFNDDNVVNIFFLRAGSFELDDNMLIWISQKFEFIRSNTCKTMKNFQIEYQIFYEYMEYYYLNLLQVYENLVHTPMYFRVSQPLPEISHDYKYDKVEEKMQIIVME